MQKKSKKNLVAINSECFKTYFKTKISKSKIFSRYKYFFSNLVIFGQNNEKWQKLKKVVENLTGSISMYLTLNSEEKNFSISHPTLRTFPIFISCGQFFVNLKKFEVPGRKNQSCWEFDGNHFFVLDIEFGRKKFFTFSPDT